MEKDIGKIKKNEITDIVIRIDDFGGKRGLTIREYNTSEKYTGFTKSGTRISADSFKTFKNIINSIDENDFAQLEAVSPKEETAVKEAPKEEKPAKKTKKKSEEVKQEDLF